MATASMGALITLMRPRQWVKNGFVLAPLVFAKLFMQPESVRAALLAMFYFCVASSAVYVVNDICDAGYDRAHPGKRGSRPIASGAVSVREALMLLAVLYAILLSGFVLVPRVLPVLFGYIGLNLAYSLGLKHKPVADIFIIAIGFVLRVYAGAVALSVAVSQWMLVTTLCLALYLASVKRLQELKAHGDNGGRNVLKHYSVRLLERYAEMSGTAAVVFYSLFIIEVRPQMEFTIPLVMFGMFRYWYVAERNGAGESPTDALLSDWPLLTIVAVWFLGCLLALSRM